MRQEATVQSGLLKLGVTFKILQVSATFSQSRSGRGGKMVEFTKCPPTPMALAMPSLGPVLPEAVWAVPEMCNGRPVL